jgi:hypothetical protein
MIWEYLILIAVLAWAVFYLWRTFFRKKGCSCGSCPSAKNTTCQSYGPGDECQQEEKAGKALNSEQ